MAKSGTSRMTIVFEATQIMTKGFGTTLTSDSLSMFKNSSHAAAIWKRHTLAEFQNWIDRLPTANLPSTRMILRPEDVRVAISKVCKNHHMEMGTHLNSLIEDINSLTHIFCDVMTAPFVRLRLDRVTTNACRKFHVDAITTRLLCTYRGTGTQYGTSVCGKDPSNILTAPTGSPIMLRGTLWPKQPNTSVLHRSPPIEGTGETRLVLVLDPIFDPGEADINFIPS